MHYVKEISNHNITFGGRIQAGTAGDFDTALFIRNKII